MTSARWQDGLWGFDLETTGPDPLEDRIVTATLVRVSPDGRVLESRDWLSDPEMEIAEAATAVHGITNEQARAEGEPRAHVVSQIFEALAAVGVSGGTICGHNVSFDLTIVASEASRLGLIGKPWELMDFTPSVLDTIVVDRHVDKYRRGKRTLEAAARHYDVPLDNAHTSSADAVAAARIALAIARAYEEWAETPAPALVAKQRPLRRAQSASFQRYLRRTDPNASAPGSWPIQGGARTCD